MKTFIGIDNGVSGTIGIIGEDYDALLKTPIFQCQDYTKKKKIISRLDGVEFSKLLNEFKDCNPVILLERPMVNPMRFAASEVALRCHEAMLIVIESLKFPYEFIDSKEWQKVLLPEGTDKKDTKSMSLEIGNRLFPQYKEFKHPDRDGILIAEYGRRKFGNRS